MSFLLWFRLKMFDLWHHTRPPACVLALPDLICPPLICLYLDVLLSHQFPLRSIKFSCPEIILWKIVFAVIAPDYLFGSFCGASACWCCVTEHVLSPRYSDLLTCWNVCVLLHEAVLWWPWWTLTSYPAFCMLPPHTHTPHSPPPQNISWNRRKPFPLKSYELLGCFLSEFSATRVCWQTPEVHVCYSAVIASVCRVQSGWRNT